MWYATSRASPRVSEAVGVVTGPRKANRIMPAATSTVAAWSSVSSGMAAKKSPLPG
jgi:hypothetical protein